MWSLEVGSSQLKPPPFSVPKTMPVFPCFNVFFKVISTLWIVFNQVLCMTPGSFPLWQYSSKVNSLNYAKKANALSCHCILWSSNCIFRMQNAHNFLYFSVLDTISWRIQHEISWKYRESDVIVIWFLIYLQLYVLSHYL